MTSNTDDQMLVLAFYLLVDVSYSMDGEPLTAVNQILPEVIDAIESSPTLGDVVRLGAIEFSDEARVRLRLGDLRDVSQVPQFVPVGATSYAAAFRVLRQEIDSDLAQLRGDNYKVYRPAVFFLTDGTPTDDDSELKQAFGELTDPNFRGRPNIIPFGVGNATKDVLDPWVFPPASGPGRSMRSYVYNGQGGAATAIRQIAEILIASIVASANSVNDAGSQGGFVPPDDQDLGDWI